MKASWLYAKNPVVVDKDLAGVVGLNEAILLRRIGDQLYVSGKDIDGRRWIKRTVSEFLEKDFPFWSRSTIRRTIDNCEKKGLLLKGNLSSSKFDKISWYSINDDKLDEMMNNAFVNGGRKKWLVTQVLY